MSKQYIQKRNDKNIYLMERNSLHLPALTIEYFNDVSLSLAPRTLANYSNQLRIFFDWASHDFLDKSPSVITESDLDGITSDDITRFLQELKHNGHSDETLRSYLISLSAMYKHLIKKKKLHNNPVEGVSRPKHKKSPKIYLDENDMERLSATIEYGSGMSKHQTKYRETIGTESRDLCIISILADTGIRVSELVGLDLNELDFERCRFTVQRKGGNIDIVYFSDETKEIIEDYLLTRKNIVADGTTALLLSYVGKSKGQRISVRAVEDIVKKYCQAAGLMNAEKMSPHKLRHSCAMNLLKKTGNLALIKKKLGHSSIVSSSIYAETDVSDLEKTRNL